jgi:hypothetical protein
MGCAQLFAIRYSLIASTALKHQIMATARSRCRTPSKKAVLAAA